MIIKTWYQTLIAEDARPFLERKIRRDDGRATFVTLAEYFKQKLRAGLRERHITEFVDDEQFDGGELRLEFQETPLVARFHQLMNEPGPSARHACVLPVPLLPRAITLSRATIYSQRASSRTSGLLSDGMAVKSKVSKLFTAGKRGARMRRSTMRLSRSMSSSSARRRRKRT